MKLPLVVYALLLLVLLLVYAVFQSRKPRRPEYAWGSGEHAKAGQAVAEMVSDSLRVLVLLATGALLSIAFGKPGLLPQYAAWVVVGAQALKCGTILREQAGLSLVLRVVVLVCLAYILFIQLPLFDVRPI
jgi:hypothetical protein